MRSDQTKMDDWMFMMGYNDSKDKCICNFRMGRTDRWAQKYQEGVRYQRNEAAKSVNNNQLKEV